MQRRREGDKSLLRLDVWRSSRFCSCSSHLDSDGTAALGFRPIEEGRLASGVFGVPACFHHLVINSVTSSSPSLPLPSL